MTVKLIKRGQIPEEKLYKATCGRCGSEFEFNGYDIQTPRDQRDTERYIQCTVCRNFIYEKAFRAAR